MTRLLRTWLVCMGLLVAVVALPLALPSPAYADEPKGTPQNTELSTKKADGGEMKCSDLQNADGAWIGKIVPCLVYTIEQSTISFTAQMVSVFKPLLFAFLTFVVVMFGLRALQGEPQIHKHGFLLLVKITIVAILLGDLGGTAAYDGSGAGGKLIPAVYNVMTESQAVVSGALSNTSFKNLKCEVSKYSGGNTPKVWELMDCIAGKMFGFVIGTGGKADMVLTTSMLGLISGFLFGGAWGVVIFFGMLGVLVTLFMMIVRTVIGFISSYLMICVMLIISPLLMPLTFLRATTPYFESWWRIILAAFLTPIVITSYVMFALIIYDKMLFADDALVQVLFKYDNIKNALKESRPAGSCPTTGDYLSYKDKLTDAQVKAEQKKVYSVPLMQQTVMTMLSGANDPCRNIKIPTFNLKEVTGGKDAAAFQKERETYDKLFKELLKFFVLAFLVNEGLKSLSDIVTKLVGKRSAIMLADAVSENEKIGAGIEGARKSMMKALETKGEKNTGTAYVSGSDFVRDMPKAISEGTKTFFDSMKQK